MTGSINLTAAQLAAITARLKDDDLRGLTFHPVLDSADGTGYYDVRVEHRSMALGDLVKGHFFVTADRAQTFTANEYAEYLAAQ